MSNQVTSTQETYDSHFISNSYFTKDAAEPLDENKPSPYRGIAGELNSIARSIITSLSAVFGQREATPSEAPQQHLNPETANKRLIALNLYLKDVEIENENDPIKQENEFKKKIDVVLMIISFEKNPKIYEDPMKEVKENLIVLEKKLEGYAPETPYYDFYQKVGRVIEMIDFYLNPPN